MGSRTKLVLAVVMLLAVIVALGAWALRSRCASDRHAVESGVRDGSSAAVELARETTSVGSVDAVEVARAAPVPTTAPPLDVATTGSRVDVRALASDGAPVANVRVVLTKDELFGIGVDPASVSDAWTRAGEALTDLDGRATIAVELGREYALEASRDGGVPHRVDHVVAGSAREIVFYPSTTLRGRVVERDGRPVAGARVACVVGVSELRGECTTGVDGSYSIAGLEGSAQRIEVATADGRATRELVSLGASAETVHDLVVSNVVLARGKVIDARTRRAIEGATIEPLGVELALPMRATSDAEGRYALAEPPNAIPTVLVVRARGYATRSAWPATDGDASVDVELEPARVIRGRVVDSIGRPVSRAIVKIAAHAMFDCGFPMIERKLPGMRVGRDGRFELDGLNLDHWHELEVLAQGFGRVKKVVRAETDAPIDLGDVVLPDAATIAGRVRVEGASFELGRAGVVVLDAETIGYETGAERKMRVDRDGRFVVHDLAAGRYVVRVELDRGAPAPVAVEIAAGERRELDLVAGAGAPIRGRVVDPWGAPIAFANVSAHDAERREVARCTSDEGGAFELANLPRGSFTLTASVGGRIESPSGPARVGVRILRDVEHGTRDVRIELPLLVSVRGVVRDANGSPVEGAVVLAQPREDASARFGSMRARTEHDGSFHVDAVEGETAIVTAGRPPATTTSLELTPIDLEQRTRIEWVVRDEELVVTLEGP